MGNTSSRKITISPPLKWAGGKRWLSHTLPAVYEPHRSRRLVEPFVGGMSVALMLRPTSALLNDINPHVINFYRWLRLGLVADRDILRAEDGAVIEMRNEKDTYYGHRERFNDLIVAGEHGSQEAALLFWYLNRTGFNGLCRFNRRGLFNTPFGKYNRIDYAGLTARFAEVSSVINRWRFTCGDFSRMKLYPSDFVYADPPYDADFTQYAAEGFSWDDQERLAHWLARHPGPVVASNMATDRIVALYEGLGFSISYLDAPRRIACNGDRRPAREILATRNL